MSETISILVVKIFEGIEMTEDMRIVEKRVREEYFKLVEAANNDGSHVSPQIAEEKKEGGNEQLRCSGLTKKGSRCLKKSATNSEFCHIHSKSAQEDNKESTPKAECVGTTVKGNKCSKFAVDGTPFCRVHCKREEESKDGEDFVFFWKPPSVFSQWTPSVFTIDGIRYENAEQWMMACKARLFQDEEILQKILAAKNPAVMKKLGRAVKNYDNNLWSKKRFEIVVQGNIAKFQQNPEMLKELLNTGEKIIVEASPMDKIWGIGLSAKNAKNLNPCDWKGQNLLGKAIMEARTRLKIDQNNLR